MQFYEDQSKLWNEKKNVYNIKEMSLYRKLVKEQILI